MTCDYLGKGNHLASKVQQAVEKQKLSFLTEKRGGTVERIISISEEEKQRNRTFLKKLLRSLYFLVKHRIPHSNTFEGLITLQIENGDIQLRSHREKCLLSSFNSSTYFSLMADESTDASSKEELSICARWK